MVTGRAPRLTEPLFPPNFSRFNTLSGPTGRQSHPLALADAREACCRSPDSTPRPRLARGLRGARRGLQQGSAFFFSLAEDLGIQDTTKRVRVTRMIRI